VGKKGITPQTEIKLQKGGGGGKTHVEKDSGRHTKGENVFVLIEERKKTRLEVRYATDIVKCAGTSSSVGPLEVSRKKGGTDKQGCKKRRNILKGHPWVIVEKGEKRGT